MKIVNCLYTMSALKTPRAKDVNLIAFLHAFKASGPEKKQKQKVVIFFYQKIVDGPFL